MGIFRIIFGKQKQRRRATQPRRYIPVQLRHVTGNIKINTRPVADGYTAEASNEKIIEFSSPAGGGLISFRLEGEQIVVEVYRTDPGVAVMASPR